LEHLVLKAVVVMVLKRPTTIHVLLAALDQDTSEMRLVRQMLTADGRFLSRRAWERLLGAVVTTVPNETTCPGDDLLAQLVPFQQDGRTVAIDSMPLRTRLRLAQGHKNDWETGHCNRIMKGLERVDDSGDTGGVDL
jgi:hypothetical protein